MAIGIVSKPILTAGDHLTRDEFLRRWEKSSDIKFAELIGGVVHIPPALSAEHGETNANVSIWLGYFRAFTPGCRSGTNTTSLIGDDSPQPDDYLAILETHGGLAQVNKYVEGSPELIAETSLTSASIDLKEKLELYEREGVLEYLVFVVKSKQIRWHRRVRGNYRLLKPDTNGVYRSRIFPGLWLDSKAFFANDMATVIGILQEGIASDEHQAFVAELAKRKAGAK